MSVGFVAEAAPSVHTKDHNHSRSDQPSAWNPMVPRLSLNGAVSKRMKINNSRTVRRRAKSLVINDYDKGQLKNARAVRCYLYKKESLEHRGTCRQLGRFPMFQHYDRVQAAVRKVARERSKRLLKQHLNMQLGW